MRRFREAGLVERLAEFTAIDFGFLADERFDFFRIIVPTLQMPAAELAFRVLFVAGALRGFLGLQFRRGWGCRFGGSRGDCGGCVSWWRWCFWSGFTHSIRSLSLIGTSSPKSK